MVQGGMRRVVGRGMRVSAGSRLSEDGRRCPLSHLVTGLCNDPEGERQTGAIRAWGKFDTASHPAAEMNARPDGGEPAWQRERSPGVIIVGGSCELRAILEGHLPRAAEINPEGILCG
jgi:hypothetical protein